MKKIIFLFTLITSSFVFAQGDVNSGDSSSVVTDSCESELIEDCVYIALWAPVCGCDGVTYSNSAEAACNSILNFTFGACELSVDEIEEEIKLYQTKYFDLMGREIVKPCNGMFIEMKYTNRGFMYDKVFLKN